MSGRRSVQESRRDQRTSHAHRVVALRGVAGVIDDLGLDQAGLIAQRTLFATTKSDPDLPWPLDCGET
jgi:hypothetical protein